MVSPEYLRYTANSSCCSSKGKIPIMASKVFDLRERFRSCTNLLYHIIFQPLRSPTSTISSFILSFTESHFSASQLIPKCKTIGQPQRNTAHKQSPARTIYPSVRREQRRAQSVHVRFKPGRARHQVLAQSSPAVLSCINNPGRAARAASAL